MNYRSAQHAWETLDALRQPLMRRWERYASLTLPRLLYPEGQDQYNSTTSHGYQSLGGQLITHLSNKLVLTMFRPTAPFFRATLVGKSLNAALEAGITEAQQTQALSAIERKAVAFLDTSGQRPKLHTLMKHLPALGNALLLQEDGKLRVQSVKYFCVKRDLYSRVQTLVTRERVYRDELPFEVQQVLPAQRGQDSTKVCHYRWVTREPNGYYRMSQWVDNTRLPAQFDGRWAPGTEPFQVQTWDLADEADYGAGLVEDNEADFEALDTLAESVVDGSVLSAEFRWLVSPTSHLSADDLKASKNGDALPGNKDDVTVIQAQTAGAVQQGMAVLERWEQRLGRAFLHAQSVQRNAERVTAEEIRLLAAELEASFGGVYTRLGAELQAPMARWALGGAGFKLDGTDIEVTVVTGLEALSRGGDLENLSRGLDIMGRISALPEAFQQRLKFDPLAVYVGAGVGVDLSQFIKSDAEFAQEQAQASANRAAEEAATAAGVAAAQPQGPA